MGVLVWFFLVTNLHGGTLGFTLDTYADCLKIREAVIQDEQWEKQSVSVCVRMRLSAPETL